MSQNGQQWKVARMRVWSWLASVVGRRREIPDGGCTRVYTVETSLDFIRQ